MPRPFTDVYDHVMPYVMAAEPALVDYQIRRVAREFLKRTTLWRATLEVILQPGDTFADLTTSIAGATVHSVIAVERDGRELPVIPEPAQLEVGRWTPGQVRGWWQRSMPRIHFAPAPIEPTTIAVTVVLTLPLDPALVELPDQLVDHYIEEWAPGVVAALLAMPRKPWTDIDMAAVYQNQYVRRLHARRSAIRDGGRPNASTLTAPRFGR